MVNNFYHQVSNSSTLKFDDFNDAVEQPWFCHLPSPVKNP